MRKIDVCTAGKITVERALGVLATCYERLIESMEEANAKVEGHSFSPTFGLVDDVALAVALSNCTKRIPVKSRLTLLERMRRLSAAGRDRLWDLWSDESEPVPITMEHDLCLLDALRDLYACEVFEGRRFDWRIDRHGSIVFD
ncbi:MAG: hypothetical protein ABSB35_01785 [Bryobacteraceae bacterium]|jgi:hypothetical protein